MPDFFPCPDCEKWVSADADWCPHCGAIVADQGSATTEGLVSEPTERTHSATLAKTRSRPRRTSTPGRHLSFWGQSLWVAGTMAVAVALCAFAISFEHVFLTPFVLLTGTALCVGLVKSTDLEDVFRQSHMRFLICLIGSIIIPPAFIMLAFAFPHPILVLLALLVGAGACIKLVLRAKLGKLPTVTLLVVGGAWACLLLLALATAAGMAPPGL